MSDSMNERIFEVDSIYKDIESLLTGNVIGEDNRKKFVENSALINERGVVMVMTIIKSHVNKNVYLSIIDNDFINIKCADLYYDLYVTLIEDLDMYNIQSIEHVDIICEIIDTCIYTALRRAFLGEERTKYYNSMTEKHSINDSSAGGLNLGR